MRWPTAAFCWNGDGGCTHALSRLSRRWRPTGRPSRSNTWRTMPCGARCGPRLSPTASRLAPGPGTAPRSAEVVAYFEQALQALAHLPEHSDTSVLAIEIRLALANPLGTLGEFGRSLALLGEAETLARVLDDRARLGRV